MKKIKIGVLGCAAIAERSMIPAIQSLPEQFELVAVASRAASKANQFAEKFHCEAIDSYEKMIQRHEIEALYIPLPTGLHEEWINKALLAGKHVYAEKSIAYTENAINQMVQNAINNDLALMEGFMFQYHSQNSQVKKMIENGIIGDIRFFSGSFGFPPFPDTHNFRYDSQIGGGAIYDACGYPIRAAFFFLGNSLQVEAASVHYDPLLKTSIFGSAFLKGNDGIGASISFGFDNYYQCNYQIWGSKGKLTVNKAFTPKIDQPTTLTLEHNNCAETIHCEADNHFAKAMLEFYDCIITQNKREKHYQEIVQQSKALEAIANLTK